MNVKEIDRALDDWRARLAAIAENLLELQVQPTYRLLSGAGGAARLEAQGATAVKAQPVRAMLNLFQSFGLLRATIDRAAEMRAALPTLVGREQRLREIDQLLRQRSIQLDEEEVPLEERMLASGAQKMARVSPEELLQAMTTTFAAARDAVLVVEAAWESLALEIGLVEGQIAAFSAQSAARESAADLDAARRGLEELRGRAQADPLGALEELRTQVQPRLGRITERIAAAARIRGRVLGARAAMDELVRAHGETVAAEAEARDKIADYVSAQAPPPGEKLEGMREWLERLDQRRGEGMIDAVSVGLQRWEAAAREMLAAERAALRANRLPFETRNELRGRFDALKAKARAFGIAESDGIAGLAEAAEALLYARPTPVGRAAAAVAEYEQALAGRKKGS